MNCSKWKSSTISCYNLKRKVSCHALYELKGMLILIVFFSSSFNFHCIDILLEVDQWFCIVAIGHTIQFFLLDIPVNKQDLDRNFYKELPCQFLGTQVNKYNITFFF
jgi:hypothetical protein